MAQLIKLNGSLWQEDYVDGNQTNDLTLQQFDDILTGAGMTATTAVGNRWHIDSFGRHTIDTNDQLVDEGNLIWVPPDPEVPGDEGYYTNPTYPLADLIEAVAGAGYTVLMHRFAPEPVVPENRFWTGLQLSVEIP